VESRVTVPALQSLITGLAVCVAMGIAVLSGQQVFVGQINWLATGLVGVACGVGGFLAVWVPMMAATWPRRVVMPPERMVFNAEIAAVPLSFDARDARRFVNDALLVINGQWMDKGGGASVRAMEAKGWSRERWNAAVGWLMDNGLLRWRNEAEHRAGLEWDFERLDRFMEV